MGNSTFPQSDTGSDDYLPHGHLPHPYYPIEAEIVGYLANTYTVAFLLASFAGICAVLFLVTGVVAKKINPGLSKVDVLTVMWFVLSKSFQEIRRRRRRSRVQEEAHVEL